MYSNATQIASANNSVAIPRPDRNCIRITASSLIGSLNEDQMRETLEERLPSRFVEVAQPKTPSSTFKDGESFGRRVDTSAQGL